MSKKSKNINLQNRFELCCIRKPQSQSVIPSSAQKGNYVGQNRSLQAKSKKYKTPNKQQFDLSYRKKHQNNNFLRYYRIKSLICPVNHLKPEDLQNFTILGTFDKKIIVGFNPNLKLFCFFDQHAMHQRIRYQYYLDCLAVFDSTNKKMKKWDRQIIEKDKKNIEVISGIRHSYISFKVIRQLDDQIQEDIFVNRYGFQIQYIKKQMTLKIIKFPLILERVFQNKIILDIAHSLILNPVNLPKSFQTIIAEISCKSAYKFNDQLDKNTIQKLIRNLIICQYPFFCVHGRPTLFTKI